MRTLRTPPTKAVPIVIVSYNTLFHTRRCIESILVHSHYPLSIPYRLIVVDNGSTDGTVEYLESLGDAVAWFTEKENLGWVKGVNNGLACALYSGLDPDFIVFGNSDIVIPGEPWWLDRYIKPLEEEGIGAVGPTSNFVMGLQKYEFNAQMPPIHEVKYLIGLFVAMKAKVAREVSQLNFGNFLDERFGLGGNDDLDLSIRIRNLGYKLLVNRKAFVYHYGSRTLLQKDVFDGREGIAKEEARTRALLVEKWGEKTVDELFIMPPGVQGRLGGAGEGI